MILGCIYKAAAVSISMMKLLASRHMKIQQFLEDDSASKQGIPLEETSKGRPRAHGTCGSCRTRAMQVALRQPDQGQHCGTIGTEVQDSCFRTLTPKSP